MLRPIGQIAAEIVADLKFRRQVIRLRRQGDRALCEAFAHLGAKHGIQTSIEQTIERFAELDPKTLEAAGGNKFLPSPHYETQPNIEPPGRPATAQSRAAQPHD